MSADHPLEPENPIADAIGARPRTFAIRWRGWSRRPRPIPARPFAPDAWCRFPTLKKDDRAAFEALRSHFKGARCRVMALDEAIAEESGDVGGRGPTEAEY